MNPLSYVSAHRAYSARLSSGVLSSYAAARSASTGSINPTQPDFGQPFNSLRSSVATSDAYDGAMGQVLPPIRVEPLDATFGAVVHDVRLAGASDAVIIELTELWLEYA